MGLFRRYLIFFAVFSDTEYFYAKLIGILYLSNKGNIRLIANFLTSCTASLCNRSDGLICNPDSSDAANLSVSSEPNVICTLLLTFSTTFNVACCDNDIKFQSLLQG